MIVRQPLHRIPKAGGSRAGGSRRNAKFDAKGEERAMEVYLQFNNCVSAKHNGSCTMGSLARAGSKARPAIER